MSQWKQEAPAGSFEDLQGPTNEQLNRIDREEDMSSKSMEEPLPTEPMLSTVSIFHPVPDGVIVKTTGTD